MYLCIDLFKMFNLAFQTSIHNHTQTPVHAVHLANKAILILNQAGVCGPTGVLQWVLEGPQQNEVQNIIML